MKRVIMVLFFMLILGNIFSQSINENHKDTIKIGFFITTLRNIDFTTNSYNADMWLWLNYKYHDNDEYKTIHNEDFVNKEPWFEWPDAIDENQGGQPKITRYTEEVDEKNKIIWKALKISTQFKKKWDLRKYPFDTQNIIMKVESADYDTSKRIIVADTCLIDPNFINQEKEWYFSNFKIGDSIIKYSTRFGDPKIDNVHKTTEYSSVYLSFDITRQNRWITFIKLFIGIFISFLISLSVFYIKPTNLDARFGLCVGGLFSAIGSKYIVDGIIPVKYQNTLLDYIHNVTFFYILIITVISIISLRLYESESLDAKEKSTKLDKYAFVVCSISYLLIVLAFIYHSTC